MRRASGKDVRRASTISPSRAPWVFPSTIRTIASSFGSYGRTILCPACVSNLPTTRSRARASTLTTLPEIRSGSRFLPADRARSSRARTVSPSIAPCIPDRSGMHGAMDGDTVLAREERARSAGRKREPDRISGSVVKVLARARERVVGRFETQAGHKIVLPYDPKLDAMVRIVEGKTHGAREGEIVEARLTSFPDARRIAHGVVEERIGFMGG